MKKKFKVDELRPEYDLKKLLEGAVRGKYAARYRASKNSEPKVDRNKFSVASDFDDADVTRYWHSQTPRARLRYMEELRRMNYGDLATKRMKRVLEIVERH